ncbi:hypothetical protein CYMTET_9194 [Cymbomonas tetramitiformis]|uniref:Uncharacterized protein n=1 Tax=Cymbomonas tetramitiformis TaxID=36881 RepID=A0AAE0LF41_9CHLO|nr:hypothetical protein CYMTET_9194 [Cymbomonas tetramitiformis]
MARIGHKTDKYIAQFHDRQEKAREAAQSHGAYQTQYMDSHSNLPIPNGQRPNTAIDLEYTFSTNHKKTHIDYSDRYVEANDDNYCPQPEHPRKFNEKPPPGNHVATDPSAALGEPHNTDPMGSTQHPPNTYKLEKSISAQAPERQHVRFGGGRKGEIDHSESKGWDGRMTCDGVNSRAHAGIRNTSRIHFQDGFMTTTQDFTGL